MKQNIIHIGLDVDDKRYHGSALNHTTGKILDFKCRPTWKGLLGQLDKLHEYFPGSTFKLCYEASYIGYTLQRDLVEKGYHCNVVAPTSIPSPRRKQVETDRIDAAQLVQFYANQQPMWKGCSETSRRNGYRLWARVQLKKHWRIMGCIWWITATGHLKNGHI